jgi:hypothetical protein
MIQKQIILLIILSGLFLSFPAHGEDQDSLKLLLEKMEQLEKHLLEMKETLQELKEAAPDTVKEVKEDTSAQEQVPLAAELLRPERKKLVEAAKPVFRTRAVGYALHVQMFSGMNYFQWLGKWGVRAVCGGLYGTILGDLEKTFKLGIGGMRSIHTFDLFKTRDFFHLYATAGMGMEWQWENFTFYRGVNYIDSFYYMEPVPVDSGFFDVPDFQVSGFAGFGTEILFLDGMRLVPEIGYRLSYYISRYQDSDKWKKSHNLSKTDNQYIGNNDDNIWEERPKSDLSLDLFFGINILFYFM